MSRALTLLLLSIGIWLVADPARPAQDASYSEDAVKAAYLHRFAAYVEWSPEAAATSEFIIGVVGSEGVLGQLDRLLPAINVGGRPAGAHAVEKMADVEDLSILYIAPGRLESSRRLIAAAASHGALIVTDDANGLSAGGVINFVRVGRNVRFEVSQPAADRAGLKIDAALLAVAARVQVR